MIKFAEVNNYDFVCKSLHYLKTNETEPSSWKKLYLFKELFKTYDFILWIDADVIIKKFDDDPFNYMEDYYQGLVYHLVGNEIWPNCGVWALSKNCYTMGYIDRMILKSHCKNHGFWEQQANIELMAEDDYFKRKTVDLPYKFNYHDVDNRGLESEASFLHAAGYPYNIRLEKMKKWLI